jgi:hypothetical protein
VGEWSRLDGANPFDVAVASSGNTSPASAGSISTTAPRDLVIFAVNSYLPNTFGAPTGGAWTMLDTQVGDSMQTVWFALVDTPGPVAPTVEESRHAWDAAIAAFRTTP